MSDPEAPKFQWGQPVQTVVDLFNDGTFPDWPSDALLVRAGDHGEIVRVGAHVDTNTNVYLVEFGGNRVIGCLEDEIVAIGSSQSEISTESQSP